MLILLEWVLIFLVVVIVLTVLYLTVRYFHRQWKWQDKVNENRMRKAMLDEFDIQYEVDAKGFVAPVPRKSRGHE